MFDSLAFEPIVLISRPISCAMKPSLRPAPSSWATSRKPRWLTGAPSSVMSSFSVKILLLQRLRSTSTCRLSRFQQAGPDRLRAGLFEARPPVWPSIITRLFSGSAIRIAPSCRRNALWPAAASVAATSAACSSSEMLRFGRYDLRQAHDGLRGGAVPSDPA